MFRASQAWPDPLRLRMVRTAAYTELVPRLYGFGWGSSCHTGGAQGILCFGCEKHIASQTANRCNILKLSYSKTLQVWKRLVVERFEELNVDVNINMHMTTMITPRRMLSDLILYYSYQRADNKNDRLQSISSETIKDKWQTLVTQSFAITSGQNSKDFLTANKAT